VGCTHEEFVTVVMPAIVTAAREKLRSVKQHVCYELDNATCHALTEDELQELGIKESQLITHPARSPDFNRVVENAHAVVCRRFIDELQSRPHLTTCKQIQDLFLQVARGDPALGPPCITVESTRKNFEGLPELWQWVYANPGKHPPRSLTH